MTLYKAHPAYVHPVATLPVGAEVKEEDSTLSAVLPIVLVAGTVVGVIVLASSITSYLKTDVRQDGKTDRTNSRQDTKAYKACLRNCKGGSCTGRSPLLLGLVCTKRDSGSYERCQRTCQYGGSDDA